MVFVQNNNDFVVGDVEKEIEEGAKELGFANVGDIDEDETEGSESASPDEE